MRDAEGGQLLFVYGTLREGAGHPRYRLLREHARSLGRATFQGALHDVGPYPAAVASAEPGARVVGELYALEPAHVAGVLAALDAYEGSPRGEAAPALYVRSRQEVEGDDGRTVSAWVYLWNRSAAHLPRIDSGDWLRHVSERRREREA